MVSVTGRRQRVSMHSTLKLREEGVVDLTETVSVDGSLVDALVDGKRVECDACPHCDDVCTDPTCSSCDAAATCDSVRCKQEEGALCPCRKQRHGVRYFTPCQVRRHNHERSAWLVAGDTIYDATAFLQRHPGGMQSILRKAGGATDCTRDFEFHSRKTRGLLKTLAIGKLRRCPSEASSTQSHGEKEWWMFW